MVLSLLIAGVLALQAYLIYDLSTVKTRLALIEDNQVRIGYIVAEMKGWGREYLAHILREHGEEVYNTLREAINRSEGS